MAYYKREIKHCEHCGEISYNYELCTECYNQAKEGIIIKNDKGQWILNVVKGNEFKFFDPNKNYYIKDPLMNEWEMRFFNLIRSALKIKYTIVPQINLQTIIETDSNKRNDELYRNVDFGLFYSYDYKPFLLIELNGQQHYTNQYWIERDKSVKNILNKAQLPILTIDIKDIKTLNDNQIRNVMRKIINYLNPNFFKKLFMKKQNKMDLSWAEELIKQEVQKNKN